MFIYDELRELEEENDIDKLAVSPLSYEILDIDRKY